MGVDEALRLRQGAYHWVPAQSQNCNVFIGIGSSLSLKAVEHTAKTGLSTGELCHVCSCLSSTSFLGGIVLGQVLNGRRKAGNTSFSFDCWSLTLIRIVSITSYTVLSCSSHSSKIMLEILHVEKHVNVSDCLRAPTFLNKPKVSALNPDISVSVVAGTAGPSHPPQQSLVFSIVIPPLMDAQIHASGLHLFSIAIYKQYISILQVDVVLCSRTLAVIHISNQCLSQSLRLRH